MSVDAARAKRGGAALGCKRAFDFVSSLLGLVLLAPLFLIVGIVIKLDSPGPVFFRQTRVGRYGSMFRICKFRTMCTVQREGSPQITVAGDSRITRAGEYLRKYKLDELPQLFNVLCGEMSLVGPRPEVPKYVALYPPDSRDIVLSVRPGITDLAAIEFLDETALLAQAADPELYYVERVMPLKLELYLRYVREWSLMHDIQLIFKTLAKLAGPTKAV